MVHMGIIPYRQQAAAGLRLPGDEQRAADVFYLFGELSVMVRRARQWGVSSGLGEASFAYSNDIAAYKELRHEDLPKAQGGKPHCYSCLCRCDSDGLWHTLQLIRHPFGNPS